MPDQARPSPRPWRRLLRFSVRGLIIVVFVIGGWLGWIVRSARIQREARVAIELNGGSVGYDWERVAAIPETRGRVVYHSERYDKSPWPVGKPWAPGWLVDIVGVDYFGHVISVWLPGKTDADNIPIGRLTRLQSLSVGNAYLSDTGLDHLKGLTELCDFQLQNTQVTDAGLAHLIGSTDLEDLNLSGTQVTDAGLAHLTGFTKLNYLNLSGTQVTDTGMAHLTRLSNVEVINLNYTEVGDPGLAHLIVLAKLRHLDLNGTQVTDAGLEHLKRPTNLLSLGVGATSVTEAGMKSLKRALPNLIIER